MGDHFSEYCAFDDMSVEIIIPASVKSTNTRLQAADSDQQSSNINFGSKQRKPFNSITIHPDNTVFATASECLILLFL